MQIHDHNKIKKGEIMNIDIRKYVIDNFKGISKEEIKDSIQESLKDKEEEILPGFGVFFELLWEGADKDLQNKILGIIEDKIKGI